MHSIKDVTSKVTTQERVQFANKLMLRAMQAMVKGDMQEYQELLRQRDELLSGETNTMRREE